MYAHAWCNRCHVILWQSGTYVRRAVGLRCPRCEQWRWVGSVRKHNLAGALFAENVTYSADSMRQAIAEQGS